ncbi:MAG: Ig-like domain-containing protein [Candidatus Kerfeldbacteria bacterium]
MNKKNIFFGIFTGLFVFILIAGGLLVASQVYAVTVDPNIGTTLSLGTADLESTIINIIQWALGFLGLVAVIMMIYGGFIWMTAAGNEDKIAKAKKIITQAAIGLVIVLLSWAIVSFIVDTANKVTGGPGTGSGSSSVFPPYEFTWNYTQTSVASGTDWAVDVTMCSRLQSVFNNKIDPATFAAVFAGDNSDLIYIEEETLPQGSGIWSGWHYPSPPATPFLTPLELVTFNNGFTLKHDDTLFGSLVQNTNYRLWIPISVTDNKSNPLADALAGAILDDHPLTGATDDAYYWQFEVGTTVDDVDPEIVSTYPLSDQASPSYEDRDVTRVPIFSINFNEAIDATTIDDSMNPGHPIVANFVLEQLDGQLGAVDSTVNNTTDLNVYITPQGFSVHLDAGLVLEPFTWYRVTVSGVQDLCGNDMVAYLPWEFQTNDLVPGVGLVNPAPGDLLVCPDIVITVPFNTSMYYDEVTIMIDGSNGDHFEAMIDASTRPPAGPYAIYGIGGYIEIIDDVDLSVAGNVINNHFRVFQFHPADAALNPVPLVSGVDYTVHVITNKPIDKDLNPLLYDWSFSVTTPDLCECAPYISHIAPGSGLREQCITVVGSCFQGTTAHPATITNFEFTDHNIIPPPPAPITPGIVGGVTATNLTSTIPAPFVQFERPKPQIEISYIDPAFGVATSDNLGAYYYVSDPNISGGPCIWGINPASGYHGTTVSLSGIRFDPHNVTQVVNFDANDAPINSWVDNFISTEVPSIAPNIATFGLNAVTIINNAGASNPVDFTVMPIPPNHPVVINRSPVCDSACVNAMIQADVSYDVTASINAANVKLYSCTDSSCSFVTGLAQIGNNPTSIFTTFTNIDISPNANLAPNTYYRVVLMKGIEINAIPGSSLGGLNFDDSDDGTLDAYSWTFKTRIDPTVCEIDNVVMNPGIPITRQINLNLNYIGSAVGFPDSCNLAGQVLNPIGFDWTWTVVDPAPPRPARATIPIVPPNPGGNNAVIHTDVNTDGTPVFVEASAQDIIGPGNASIQGELTINDCTNNIDCENACPVDGNHSTCDLTTFKCTPWVGDLTVPLPPIQPLGWGLNPDSGPTGTTVTITGCNFGNITGVLEFGGNPGIFNCANPWTDSEIIATVNVPAIGLYGVRINTVDGLSNAAQAPTVMFTATNLCASGAQPPITGLPGLCNVVPAAAYEGTNPITYNGYNLTLNNTPQTIARFDDGVGGYINDITGQGFDTTFDNVTVPLGAVTGKTRISVIEPAGPLYCDSNEVNFGISCSNNSHCIDAGFGSCCNTTTNICDPSGGFCSLGGPGSACQLPANFTSNGFCGAPAPLVTDNNYRCIDNSGNLDPDGNGDFDAPPKTITTIGVPANNSCITCCDPDVNNNNVLNEPNDQQISSTGLTCVANKGNCTNNQRGLYCGCDYDPSDPAPGDAQCGTEFCGKDTCCYNRPFITSTIPVDGAGNVCRNASISIYFAGAAIDPATVNDINIMIIEGGVLIPLTASVSLAGDEIIISPTGLMDPTTVYHLFMKAGPEGVLSTLGIAMEHDPVYFTSNVYPDIYPDFHISFTTGDIICQVDNLLVQSTILPLSTYDISYYGDLFTCAGDACLGDYVPMPGNQHLYTATPRDNNNQNLTIGSFTWAWTENDPVDIFTTTVTGVDNSRYITSNNQNGAASLSIGADGSTFNYGSLTQNVSIRNILCESPWPNVSAGETLPFEDSVQYPKIDTITTNNNFDTNFSTWYCLDGGLPTLKLVIDTVVHEGTPSTIGVDELLKEFFFLRDLSDDAIGIRVYENEEGKSAREWYFNHFGSAAPAPQDIVVDGYNAIRSGRTVYVAAWNISGTGFDGAAQVGDALYPQLYLISYNEGASAETLSIYNALLANWKFTINDTDTNKEKMHRDMKRVSDLNDIYTGALEYKEINGEFPKLEGGTYIKNLTSSGWPSWSDKLGSSLGLSMPTDPYNIFDICLAPFNTSTCWDDTNQEYFCPSNSYTYQYIVSPDGKNVDLYGHLEYLIYGGFNTWNIGLAGVFDPCSSFTNADCNCFNYFKNVTGTITDRVGPQFDAVTLNTVAPVANIFNNVNGTQAVEVILTDLPIATATGVAKVEFYIDGQYKYTDDDPASWSWNFISNEYVDGNHSLLLKAYDNVGNWSNSPTYTLVINNSGVVNNPPFIDIISLADGQTITGTVPIDVVASDDGGIIGVEIHAFDSDGVETPCALHVFGGLSNPYSGTHLWDTVGDCTGPPIAPDTPNGIYTLIATATDNTTLVSTKTIFVKVENFDTTAPVVTIGNIPGTCSGVGPPCNQVTPCGAGIICQRKDVIDIDITVDDLNWIDYVQVFVDNIFRGNATHVANNQWTWEWDTLGYLNEEHDIRIDAYDMYGNIGSATITIPVDNEMNDKIAPTISFIHPPTPIYGTAVVGDIDIEVDANDNRGVQHVNFYIDYHRQFVDPLVPYSYAINTDVLTDGWHSIQAEAVDTAGNRSESIEILVNVRGNGGPQIIMPTVNPPTGGTGTDFCFRAEVTDADGIASVQAVLQNPDGISVISANNPVAMTDPDLDNIFEGVWTSDISNTTFYVDVIAEDNAGNISFYDNIPSVAGACGAPVCVPNGCGGGCPPTCTIVEDPDCACQVASNGCCPAGLGCTFATDNDCPLVVGGPLLVGTYPNGDVLRSDDGGATWVNTGDLPGVTHVYDLLISGNRILAATGLNGQIFYSDDGGGSWTASTGLDPGETQFADIHERGGILYIGSRAGQNFYRSLNNGTTWIQMTNAIGRQGVTGIATIGPVDIYLTTHNGGVVFHSNDEGANWTEVTSFPTLGVGFHAYSIIEGNGRLYAGGGVSRQEVIYSDDGIAWAPTPNVSLTQNIETLFFSNNRVITGGCCSAEDIFTSDNFGASWDLREDFNTTNAFVVNKFTKDSVDTLFAATDGMVGHSWIYSSYNNGTNWNQLANVSTMGVDGILSITTGTIPPLAACIAPVVNTQSATGTVGVSFSYGITISQGTLPITYSLSVVPLPAGLSLNATSGVISGTPTAAIIQTRSVTATNACGADTNWLTLSIFGPVCPNGICEPGENNANCPLDCPILLAATRPNGGIFKSTDGGANWNNIGNLAGANEVYSLLETGGAIYAGTTPNSVVFKSTNGGANWNITGNLAGAITVYSLLETGGAIYAGTSPNSVVFKSTNGGTDWNIAGNITGASGGAHSLLETGGAIYVGTGVNGGIFKSTDGGANWNITGNLAGANTIYSLLETGGAIYAGTSPDGDIFKSTNGGADWNITGNLAGATRVYSLLEIGGAIYAGTSNNGDIFKSTNGGADWNITGNLAGATGVFFLTEIGNSIYAGTGASGDIFKSTNGGADWNITGNLAGASGAQFLLVL